MQGSPLPPARAVRLPLRRPSRRRVFGGVCAGVSAHLEVRLDLVRWTFIALALAGGAGLAMYVFLWVTVPPGDPAQAARLVADPGRARGARPIADTTVEPVRRAITSVFERLAISDIAVGIILVTVALSLVGTQLGWQLHAQWLVPVLIVAAGAVLAWSQLDAAQRGRLLERAGGRTPWGVVRLSGGLTLVILGVLLLVGQDSTPQTMVTAAMAALAVLAGAALVLAPWGLRLLNDLGEERAARERSEERADIAAHLHDSVLQTLSMIQRVAGSPADVARLARTQERELRQWLYEDSPATGTSLAADLRALAASIEDRWDVSIDTVVVGDANPTENSAALLQATREALLNAVAHGSPPISLYLEAGPGEVEISVRDHGPGFDPQEVPADRLGVRESIVGRVTRRGGSVEIRRAPGAGTEVRMRMPWHGHPSDDLPEAITSETTLEE